MELTTNPQYRRALQKADFAIVDSIYLTLLWRLMTRRQLHRISGLAFLRAFLASGLGRQPRELFLVNPSDEDTSANLRLLRDCGFAVSEADAYTAPQYDRSRIEDQALVDLIEQRRPRYVLLNLGGGVQEPLGCYLKESLSYSPAIVCTGAAIAFLTGRQASISPRIDAWGLGWLVRSLTEPRRLVPRYFSAIGLARMVWTHGRSAPPIPQCP
jgi:N-acetylglucosaminyldiphosphoundecaprenol N-acetyl-beta-D-mannosaminyltransferase